MAICYLVFLIFNQSTYKREAKGLMIQHEVQENGMVVVYHREIKGDEMHVVRFKLLNRVELILYKLQLVIYLIIWCDLQKVTCGDLVANRLYKKM